MLWKSYFGLVRDHFGECAMEKLLWVSQGPLRRVCCGRAILVCRGHFGECAVEELLWVRDHFGECAVEGLVWASQGPLRRVCCGRATGRTEVPSSENLATRWRKNKLLLV